MTSEEVLQRDLRDLLGALGLPDCARPQTPHQVFRECIAEVRRLKAAEPQNIVERIAIAETTLRDAKALLDSYYVKPAADGMVALLTESRHTEVGQLTRR